MLSHCKLNDVVDISPVSTADPSIDTLALVTAAHSAKSLIPLNSTPFPSNPTS